ncbi:MAG: hypothetical protein KGI02_09290 [Thaumarchaeota archaeon]|nr:hypothetical protein [Nitrososphaerota archaeon]
MKIQNKKTKTATSIISAIVIGLIMSSSVTVLPNVNATNALGQDVQPVRIAPPAPSKVGCYHWTKETGWLPIGCMPESDVKKLGLAMEGNSYGVYGGQEYNQNTLNFGLVQANLATYSGGEYDTINGADAYSIQDNTNTYQDKNSKTGWVQFLFQQIATQNVAGACIEQWENGVMISTGNYCTPVPVQALSQGYNTYVDGSTNSGAGTVTVNFCSTQCWANTDTDYTGLAGRWNQVTGTILGESSTQTQTGEAVFPSGTVEYTTVQAGAPSAFSYGVGSSTQTQEENNLNYVSSYTSTSCSGSTCTTYTESTYP